MTRKRKRGEELSVDPAIEASKPITGVPERGKVEIDTQSFYGPAEISRTYGDKEPRASVPANLEGDSRRGVSLET